MLKRTIPGPLAVKGLGRIPHDAPYALLRSPAELPFVYPTLSALSGRIHRDRGDAAIEIVNIMLFLVDEPEGRPVAGVWTLSEGARRHFIGYAWVGDCQSPRDRLHGALLANKPRLFSPCEAA